MTTSRQSTIGQRTHQLIGRLAATGKPIRPALVLAEAGRLLKHKPLSRRNRAARLQVAGLAGVYFAWLAPPSTWDYVGHEVTVDGGRIDLVWRSPDNQLLFDEIKTTGHTHPLVDTPTENQVLTYLQAASGFNQPTIGVRVLALSAPNASVLVTAPWTITRLVDTDLWFATNTPYQPHDPAHPAEDEDTKEKAA